MNLLRYAMISICLLTFTYLSSAKEPAVSDSVYKLEHPSGFYQLNNWYLGGQPNLSDLEWFKENDVKLIINLRSEGENEDFTRYAFDEKALVESWGIEYVSITVGGYSPEKLDTFAQHLDNAPGKILIHCAGAGRVTHFVMAYLIKYDKHTVNESVKIGKQIKFSMPVEKLLGQDVNMSLRSE